MLFLNNFPAVKCYHFQGQWGVFLLHRERRRCRRRFSGLRSELCGFLSLTVLDCIYCLCTLPFCPPVPHWSNPPPCALVMIPALCARVTHFRRRRGRFMGKEFSMQFERLAHHGWKHFHITPGYGREESMNKGGCKQKASHSQKTFPGLFFSRVEASPREQVVVFFPYLRPPPPSPLPGPIKRLQSFPEMKLPWVRVSGNLNSKTGIERGFGLGLSE